MIVLNHGDQWIGCSLCQETTELRRATLANPEKLMLLAEQMKKEHAACERYKQQPALAKLNRDFERRVSRALASSRAAASRRTHPRPRKETS